MKAKRNEPCPCGSGLKYKKCHGAIEAESKKVQRTFSVQDSGQNPMLSFAQKIVNIVESEDAPHKSSLPPSKASTKEAETPELVPPSTYTPEGKNE
ncbi:MAG: SEC-C domain-containing protein [Verrucomicrobia bacterium]|nr:SEC-C domain-containing protein [Verrucomicrobiota bacterium]MBS0636088.1 SEC-C domain-containing protein [Verrucomicrobiota bacterium]